MDEDDYGKFKPERVKRMNSKTRNKTGHSSGIFCKGCIMIYCTFSCRHIVGRDVDKNDNLPENIYHRAHSRPTLLLHIGIYKLEE